MVRKRIRQEDDADVQILEDGADRPAQVEPAGERAQPAAPAPGGRRGDMAALARRRAAHFAHFKEDDVGEGGADNVHAGGDEARGLGPWSSAMQLVGARERAAEQRKDRILSRARQEAEGAADMPWRPSRDPQLGPRPAPALPSLFDAALAVLVQHIGAVVSLWGAPDAIRTPLAVAVCAARRLSPEVAALFADHAPSELVLPNCADLDAASMARVVAAAASARLERLELGFCGRGFGSEAVEAVAGAGPLSRLSSLALQGAYRLGDAAATRLLGCAPGVVRLALPQCSLLGGATLAALPGLLPRLASLDLSECRGVPGDALVAVLPRLSALTSLSLDGLADEVDDAVLLAAAGAPALRELSVAACGRVSDEGVAALAAAAPRLSALRLDECGRVGDAGVAALAAACPGLALLSLRRCMRVGDAGVVAVAGRGALRVLVVNGLHGLTGAALRALATYCCDSLEELDVSFCRGLPEEGLGLVADACPRLRLLRCYGCSQLGPSFLHGHSNEALACGGLRGVGTLSAAVKAKAAATAAAAGAAAAAAAAGAAGAVAGAGAAAAGGGAATGVLGVVAA